MTIFVASLFLPYTINFDVDRRPAQDHDVRSTPQGPPSTASANDPTLSVFTPGIVHTRTNPHAPSSGHATHGPARGQGDFFFGNTSNSSDAIPTLATANHPLPRRLPSLTTLADPIPNEPHSPIWGQTGYLQPRSRAANAPPADLAGYRHLLASLHAPGRSNSLTSQYEDNDSEKDLEAAQWSIKPAEQGNGGLRNAINAGLREGVLQEITWIGTLGMPTDALGDDRKAEIADRLELEMDCLAIYPSDSDFNGHYTHFSKTILWPIFHYQVPDNPKSKAYLDHSWVHYERVNQLVADRIVKSWKRGDVIWVHDYHLLLVPSMIRKKLPEAEIGFSLHVGFPSSEVFRCLAMRRPLLEGMLGANLVCFQTAEYSRHFLQTCNRLLCVEATQTGVQLDDRFVDVAVMPIGIDPETLSKARDTPEVRSWLEKIQTKYAGQHLIVARDKLDGMRGVRPKLLSYERFLKRYPQYRQNVVLIQVATSTTEQLELEAAVSDIVTRINSTFSTLEHQPLIFLNQDMDYARYLAMLTAADALMITSLREGMNLTSHEFVFCQDGKISNRQHGTLILSEFTGSAAVFQGDELSVNPWDYNQCAEAIRTALLYSPGERQARWQRLSARVLEQTALKWLQGTLSTLRRAWEQHSRQHTLSIPRLSFADLGKKYKATNSRLFILDHEGTLSVSDRPHRLSYMNPQRTLDALVALTDDPRNLVYVVSGQKPEDLQAAFRRVPRLGLVAENGLLLRDAVRDRSGPTTPVRLAAPSLDDRAANQPNDAEYCPAGWQKLGQTQGIAAWKESVVQILAYYRERLDGSWIETRHTSVLFHHGAATDRDAAQRLAGECAHHVGDACAQFPVRAVPFDGGLCVESTEWDKSTAADAILCKLQREAPVALARAPKARRNSVKGRRQSSEGRDSDQATDVKGASGAEFSKGPESSLSVTTSPMLSASSSPRGHEMPQFLLVMGDARDDEVLYQWAHRVAADKTIRDVTTVSASSRNTEAQATLTQGVTGVLSTLLRLATVA